MSSRLNKIWVISDTHFNHKFMTKEGIRPDDYQQKIINFWRARVSQNDIIIHLGDVIFDRPSELTDILNSLPGYKILVKGNHDNNKDNWYLTHGFNEVHDEYIVTLPNRKRALCTHKPTLTELDYNLCGHLHNYKDDLYRHPVSNNMSKKTRVYSCELEGYKPILIDNLTSDYHQSHLFIMENATLKMKTGAVKEKLGDKLNKFCKKIYDIGQIKIF